MSFFRWTYKFGIVQYNIYPQDLIMLSMKSFIKIFLTRTGNYISFQTTCYEFSIIRFMQYMLQDITIIKEIEEYNFSYQDNVNETKNVNMLLQFQIQLSMIIIYRLHCDIVQNGKINSEWIKQRRPGNKYNGHKLWNG